MFFCGGLFGGVGFFSFDFVLFYSTSGVLLKYYLLWDSHKGNTEPEFPIFLNPQREETGVPCFWWEMKFNSSC